MSDDAQHPGPRLLRWAALAMAVFAVVLLALNLTAVPVVLNVPVVSLIVACLAATLFILDFVRKRTPPSDAASKMSAFGLAVALASVAVPAYLGFLSVAHEEIAIYNGEVTLAGTLYRPRTPGPHPATVILHGSGPESRREYAYYARRFARAGIATLVYDKRGVGDSTGKLYDSEYRDYAADAAAAVHALRSRQDIVANRVGLVGFSEGEWTAPLAALEVGDIAFIAVIGASGTSPARQVNAEMAMRLRARGYPDEVIAGALALNDLVFDYQRTGEGADALGQELEAARSQPWFAAAEDIPEKIYPFEEYAWWRSVMDFDPSPVWQRIAAPVLILKGEQDAHSPADVAEREITSALSSGGNQKVDFIIVRDGDHMLLRWPLGDGVAPPLFADRWLQTLIGWMKARLDDAA